MGGSSDGPRAIKLLTDLCEVVRLGKSNQIMKNIWGPSDGPRAIFLADQGEVVQSVQCHIWTTQWWARRWTSAIRVLRPYGRSVD